MRKRRVVGRIYGMKYSEIQLKSPQDTRTEYIYIKSGQGRLVYVKDINICQRHKPQRPHHVKVSPRGLLL